MEPGLTPRPRRRSSQGDAHDEGAVIPRRCDAVTRALGRLRDVLVCGEVPLAGSLVFLYQRPHTWKGDVERLFALLEEIGEARFRVVLQRALFQRLIGAEYVVCVAARLGAPDAAAVS